MVISVLTWIVVALGLMAVFNRFTVPRKPAAGAVAVVPLGGPPDSCELLPPSGSHSVIEPAVMRRTDVQYSGLEFQNRHSYPMVVVLTDPQGSAPYQSISLASGEDVQVGAPIGRYGVQVLTGTKWCNLDAGFTDGARVRINGGVAVRARATTNIQFRSIGAQPGQFSVTYRTTGPVGAAGP